MPPLQGSFHWPTVTQGFTLGYELKVSPSGLPVERPTREDNRPGLPVERPTREDNRPVTRAKRLA